MIDSVLSSLRRAFSLILKHRSYIYTSALLVLIPAAFLISGQQFLQVAKERHIRAEHARIGLLHDTLAAYLRETHNTDGLVRLASDVGSLNPDIYSIVLLPRYDDLFPLVLHGSSVAPEMYRDFLRAASMRTDESLLFDTYQNGEHLSVGVRAVLDGATDAYLITVSSQKAMDEIYAAKVRVAYYYLIIMLVIILIVVVRHARIINYAELYAGLQNALNAKTQFINMTAHELRAPLSAMRGYASMIRETKGLPPQVVNYAERIETSSAFMVRLVSDMLDVAKIESGGLSLAKDVVRIKEVFETLIARLMPLAREHGLTLMTDVTDSSLAITVDRTRLEQILTNLISNSLKYTKEGGVTLAASLTHGMCELRIKDTGTGMTAEDQHKLFSPYFRTEDAEASKEMGTGLGMWIAKQFIEKMGGTVAVESIHGVGTHVVVVFPLAKA